ncbi:MAG TPA: 23S rRNA (adenine(2503)-C(2))-methyltransferase RlmN, partial [Planctomycetaceae bacterium]|nr:23S rRNA (adenine(2503)-C(2))-methyltransferase RlmN [Planctomycetaceae bacterium]
MSSILSTSVRPISDLARDELARWCGEHGESPYRVDQIRRWIFGQRGDSFDGMHDLPARLRTALAGSFRL